MKNNIIIYFLLTALASWSATPLHAQDVQAAADDIIIGLSPSAQLALSTADYRVTAGDIYTLAYFAGSNSVEYTITVDSTYKIRVSNLGIIDVAGKTFNQVKTQVETIVSNNYPMGAVQFVLRQPAVFKVYIRGEVRTTHEMQVWALSRLSSVIGRNLTDYSSTRDIQIRSSNGQARTYDLFKANRNGDLAQDPFVRPDDIITISRLQRRVTINGAVERPGGYQLLAGENLKQLVELYGNGLTPSADTSRIELVRYINSDSISGDRTYLTKEDLTNNFTLQNYDVITIRSINTERPVFNRERIERSITIDGAVRRPGTYQLRPDENLKDLIEVYGDGLTPVADTSRIEMVRYVNSSAASGVRTLLTARNIAADYALQHLDHITVPSITERRPAVTLERIERSITIDGAVRRPGTYELGPNETLKDLVEVYGDGLTPVADTSRIVMLRYVNSNATSGDRRLLTEKDIAAGLALQHLDHITIPSITERRPVVTLDRIERSITIEGAVRRPGTYELGPDETLKDLVEAYGDGLTPLADTSRIVMVRYINGESGDRRLLTEKDIAAGLALQHLDHITIPSITERRPVVTLDRIERSITIEGAVRRPGTYQVGPNENLKALVEVYADGFSPVADTSRIELTRYVNSDSIAGNKIMLSESNVGEDFHIEHLDAISVPTISGLRPVVFVEGAIGVAVEGGTQVAPEASTRLSIMFNPGETYGALVRGNRSWFTAVSDTQSAYILRGVNNTRIPLNLNPYLYDALYHNDVVIEENDTLIIPFRQYFISVAGAVAAPGRYPYIPDRTWEYYIALAGGFDPNRNSGEKVTITDISGKKMKKSDAITPETIITAESNKWLYGFNQIAPVITTSLTIITTFLSLYMFLNQ